MGENLKSQKRLNIVINKSHKGMFQDVSSPCSYELSGYLCSPSQPDPANTDWQHQQPGTIQNKRLQVELGETFFFFSFSYFVSKETS